MADRIAVDEEQNKKLRLENDRKRMKEVDLLSKVLPDTKSQTKEMSGIQTQANALIDPKLYTDMTVNWRATASLMDKPLDELDATQYEDYKSQVAVMLNRPAPKSEGEYRSMLSEHFVKEKGKDTALNELYGNIVLKAFQDTNMGKNRALVGLPTDYVKEWEAKHKDLIDGDTGYHAQANQVYNQTLKDIDSIRGKGAETFSALIDFTQGKADGERIAQVAEHLSSSTPEERQKVYRYVGLAAEAGHIDKGGLEQFAINMGQSFSRGFDFVPQGTLQGQEDAFIEMRDTLATGKVWLKKAEGTPTLNDVYRPSQGAVGSAININMTGREATPEEVATLKAQAEFGLKTFGVIRELRNVAKTEVDPIRPVFDNSAIERGAYGLAGSIGIMAPVALNPVLGMMAYQAQEFDRIMLENPDMNRSAAKGLSYLEGAGNAALDRLQLGAINGKLPVFGGLLNGIKNNGVRRVLTTIGVEVLEQNLQEGAQDLIAPLAETMAAALREDMPDKDFGALMKDYIGGRAETFFAVLPLALLGGGIGTYRDLKNPAMQMADRRLQEAGFGPSQRDYINQAESLEEKASRIEQEWTKRSETNITAGKELLAASISEAKQSKAGDTVEVNTKADGTNEWIVRDPAGKEVARVANEEEAVTIIADRGSAEIRSQANVVADLLDSDWRKDKLPNFEAQFGGEVTPEQLLKDAEANGDAKLVEAIKASIEAHGNDPAELAKLRVLGESRITPYAEGQYKALIKLNEGYTAQDAFEELAHSIFDIDIAEGRITKEQARAWVSQTTASGVAKYKFGTDAEVRESMAQIAQDFAHNKLDQTNLPSSFVAFLKKLYTEFVELMRRAKLLDQAFTEGKIDPKFERYLSEKIGLSDATMIEREVNRIEGEQKSDVNTSFSIRARDEAYDAAVNSGDEAEQQRLVDEAAKEAGYTVGPVYHGTPTGGFDVFREQPTYFAGEKADADIYQSSTASSIRVTGTPDGTPETKKVFLKADNVFDTRKPKDRQRFENEFLGKSGEEWGSNGTPIGERGLPDWTDGRDLVDWINEEGLSYDALALDEGGFPQSDGTVRVKGASVVVWKPHQIKSADPITRDDAGNVIPLSQRFNPDSNDIRFSIQSQDQIDRVNKAVADTTQFAEGRMALYEKAKERFKAVLAENKDILDALKEGGALPEKIRRAKLIQGIAELEVILRQLPAEVRGKVGGFGVLARGGTGDTFLANFFKDRVRMIDDELEKYLSKEYDDELYRVFERSKPKKDKPGEKPKGIGDEIQALFAQLKEARKYTPEKLESEIAKLETELDQVERSEAHGWDEVKEKAKEEARLIQTINLISKVGAWDPKYSAKTKADGSTSIVKVYNGKTSNEKADAIKSLKSAWARGYADFQLKKIKEREEREAIQSSMKTATNKAGTEAERIQKQLSEMGMKDGWGKSIYDLSSFDQVINLIFGDNSEIANELTDVQRKAENQKEDNLQRKYEEVENLFTKLAGSTLKGKQLQYDMMQPSIKLEGQYKGIELSQMAAISDIMMWNQEDGRRHMEGRYDENGKPISKWHYTQEFVDFLEKNLTPEARVVMDFLLKKYAEEHPEINKVYKPLNGISLVSIENYAPLSVTPQQQKSGQMVDPTTGQSFSSATITPRSLLTRGTSIAQPNITVDAVQKYLSHTRQMEHWKAFAPVMTKYGTALRNRDVLDSIEAKAGKAGRTAITNWLDYMTAGGVREAGASLWTNKMVNDVMGRAAQIALFGRAGTILLQSTQLAAASAVMPHRAYMVRLSKLLTGNLGWKDAIKSEYIQRRIKQMPVVEQQAMQELATARPSRVMEIQRFLGNTLSAADGLFTAGTFAMVYDYQLSQAKENGMTGKEAEDFALNETERISDRIAQPTRAGARSMWELTATAPAARLAFSFASESRKNFSLLAYAKATDGIFSARFFRAVTYTVILSGVLSSIARNAWKDLKDDSDDEWFDEKHWGWKRLLMMSATDPLNGIPLVGSSAQEAVLHLGGVYYQNDNLLSLNKAASTARQLPKYWEGDWTSDQAMRDVDTILSVAGMANQNIAAYASLSHLANDAFGVAKNTKKAVTGE
jgi:hypothetical protein